MNESDLDPRHLAPWLRDLLIVEMREKGMMVKDIAERVGLHHNTVEKILSKAGCKKRQPKATSTS